MHQMLTMQGNTRDLLDHVTTKNANFYHLCNKLQPIYPNQSCEKYIWYQPKKSKKKFGPGPKTAHFSPGFRRPILGPGPKTGTKSCPDRDQKVGPDPNSGPDLCKAFRGSEGFVTKL